MSHSSNVALTVDLPHELQTPVEVALSTPARVRVQHEAGGDLSLRIAAAGRQYRSFPAFWGVLRVAPSRNNGSATVTLLGTYSIPPHLTAGVDQTFLRRAAHSALRRFLENVIAQATLLHSSV
ncbi:MAG TPA: hypothetical protein VFH72_08770 [Candidatus Baltobacteraceae bacterium]|nr:hypothetical protein [Candidatus Baltobacteraceae bacterium]